MSKYTKQDIIRIVGEEDVEFTDSPALPPPQRSVSKYTWDLLQRASGQDGGHHR